MSETNILEIENFCVYFENKLEQLGAFNETCMNECVSMSISIRVIGRLSPQYGLWSMARMKRTE